MHVEGVKCVHIQNLLPYKSVDFSYFEFHVSEYKYILQPRC